MLLPGNAGGDDRTAADIRGRRIEELAHFPLDERGGEMLDPGVGAAVLPPIADLVHRPLEHVDGHRLDRGLTQGGIDQRFRSGAVDLDERLDEQRGDLVDRWISHRAGAYLVSIAALAPCRGEEGLLAKQQSNCLADGHAASRVVAEPIDDGDIPLAE